MASLPAFRVLVSTISIAESTLPLTFFDLAWVNAGAVERVFFYHIPHSTSDFFDSILPDLKSSLSLALQQFYRLAGKICHPLDKISPAPMDVTSTCCDPWFPSYPSLTTAECRRWPCR
ncbi:unnamed protein product [Musa banksii]